MDKHIPPQKHTKVFLLLLFPIALWSFIDPKSTSLWVAEISPLIIGIIAMIVSSKKYPLSVYSYVIIFIGATLMLVGSHYSYSRVPMFEWLKTVLELERNNYDKVVHFFQGFIMASLMKELLLRKKVLPSMRWTNFFALTFAIAVGALWELIEWLFVLIAIPCKMKTPTSGFLGTQGYNWDAQSDIFFAIVGALATLFLFRKYHEESIRKVLEEQQKQ